MPRHISRCVLVLSFLLAATKPCPGEEKVFTLGIISDKPVEKKIAGYAPLAKYVAERLKEYGIAKGKVLVATDLNEMLQMIRSRKVDVVLESAFNTLKMQEQARVKPTLLVWKHGVKEYRTVFFVRGDSPIKSLSDLKRKILALQDIGSTTAFLIPLAELKRNGLKVVKANSQRSSAIRYVLVAHAKNQAFWVLQKKADAAAFSNDDWMELAKSEKNELRLIHTTGPVLRYLASVHPSLAPEMAGAVAAILVGMDRDPQGRKILAGASEIKKMEPLSAQDRKSLEYVRELMRVL